MSISKKSDETIVFCCDKIMKTAFCPHCGISKEVKINDKSPYPYRFKIYLHSHDYDNYDLHNLVDKLGLTQHDRIYDEIIEIIECAHKVVEYEITARDGQINLIAVNGRSLK